MSSQWSKDGLFNKWYWHWDYSVVIWKTVKSVNASLIAYDLVYYKWLKSLYKTKP